MRKVKYTSAEWMNNGILVPQSTSKPTLHMYSIMEFLKV